ncbi:MAG: hypothetical protein IPK09_00025 [Candidatus Competibacteraceae bacterium]|nr:hypothetical protein [Candidatus Competibacteraceae bacterium]
MAPDLDSLPGGWSLLPQLLFLALLLVLPAAVAVALPRVRDELVRAQLEGLRFRSLIISAVGGALLLTVYWMREPRIALAYKMLASG